jgi:hypothetical protein
MNSHGTEKFTLGANNENYNFRGISRFIISTIQ